MNPKLMKVLVTLLIIITIAGAGILYVVLTKEDNTGKAKTLDEMVEFSYTTEEMRTDLKDDHYVLIQFRFMMNSKAGKEEIEKREFQVKNEFIKQSVKLTVNDFQDNLEKLESEIQTVMNQKMTDGVIDEVLIISKVVQ
ncbi:flagellar basal body-associated FliL family protein [Gracilibacillus sp. YIM 98692]|uniref:flagellar basal body-associated FliL family protein n=1 Tax=Gracilibacillus sp. YIM 98692 TaxID=2663532 RepID=UPI0013D6097A|nr:flagellar basal body-associated FliL family protein [Gracilibacillus sp. YIM 98692]